MTLTPQQGVPIPPKHMRNGLKASLLSLNIAEAITVDTLNQSKVALNMHRTGIARFTTRKIQGEGYRIWRVA